MCIKVIERSQASIEWVFETIASPICRIFVFDSGRRVVALVKFYPEPYCQRLGRTRKYNRAAVENI